MLINQFGSERRMQMALGVEALDEIAERIRQFMDMKSPEGFLEKLKMLPMLAEMGKFFPKTVATGPCKEVIRRENFSLLDFPILQCWPQGWRTIHHAALRDHPRSQDRQAQRRHVPHAGV